MPLETATSLPTTVPAIQTLAAGQLPSIPRDLVFLGTENGNTQIKRWNKATGRIESITHWKDANADDYAISGDGRAITVKRVEKGADQASLELIDLSTLKSTVLAVGLQSVKQIRFSPDGRWVSFIAGAKPLPPQSNQKGYEPYDVEAVYAIPVAQPKHIQQLGTCHDKRGGGFCLEYLWAADSQKILWNDIDELESFRVTLDHPQQVYFYKFPDRGYWVNSWSPDGRYIQGRVDYWAGHKGSERYFIDLETNEMVMFPYSYIFDSWNTAFESTWLKDGRFFVLRSDLNRNNRFGPKPVVGEIWRIRTQGRMQFTLEETIDITNQTGSIGMAPVEIGSNRVAFLIGLKDNSNFENRGAYVLDLLTNNLKKMNGLPPEGSHPGRVIWDVEGGAVLLQGIDDEGFRIGLYIPADGSAIYDLSHMLGESPRNGHWAN